MYYLKLCISSSNLLKSCLQLQCLCLCANKPKGAVKFGHVISHVLIVMDGSLSPVQ